MSLPVHIESNERDVERTPNVHKMSIELNAHFPSTCSPRQGRKWADKKECHAERLDIRARRFVKIGARRRWFRYRLSFADSLKLSGFGFASQPNTHFTIPTKYKSIKYHSAQHFSGTEKNMGKWPPFSVACFSSYCYSTKCLNSPTLWRCAARGGQQDLSIFINKKFNMAYCVIYVWPFFSTKMIALTHAHTDVPMRNAIRNRGQRGAHTIDSIHNKQCMSS